MEGKNCTTCYNLWETSDGTTKYCVLKINEGGRDPKCSLFEIENGCDYWAKRSGQP